MALALDRDLDLDLDRALDRALDSLLVGTLNSIHLVAEGGGGWHIVSLISSWLTEAAERSAALGLHEMQKLLAELVVPGEGAPKSAWLTLAEDLRTVTVAHRDIGPEEMLDEERAGQLERYLQANRLLLDCLQVAYVSDREGLADRLLFVP